MSSQQDYLFWRLADVLISSHDYRIVQLAANEQELWLENIKNNKAQVIRILRCNLDWSNWMQRDIEVTSSIGERFRQKYIRGELRLLNIYVTPYPPVDEYLFRIEKPFINPNSNKTTITTLLFEPSHYIDSLQQLSTFIGKNISITLKEQYDEKEIESIKKIAIDNSINKEKKEKAVFENGKPFFTYVLLLLQIAFFLLLEANGGSKDTSTLIKFGAKLNPLIIEGEWWRFFTPLVLHIGFLHLLMNSIALYYLGPLVERIYGNTRFLLIYLFAGFAGSLASFVFSPHLSAGASGAIFGCFGALLYFGIVFPKIFFRTMGMNILIVIGINLAFGFTVPGIDNAGHIGGLIGGFLAAGILHFPKKHKLVGQLLFFLFSIVIVTGMLFWGYGESTRVTDVESSFALAQTYVEDEKYDKAYTLLKDIEKQEERSGDVLFMLSYIELKKGMTQEAKQHLLQVVEMNPKFHEAFYNLSLIYLNEQNLTEALKLAEAALQLDPNRSEYKDLVAKIKGNMPGSSSSQ